MPNTLLLVPTGAGVGLSTVILGIARAFEEQGLRVKRFKPVDQNKARSGEIPAHTISAQKVEQLLGNGETDNLLEEILANFKAVSENTDIVLVQGLIVTPDQAYASQVNIGLAATLDAKVVIITTPGNHSLKELDSQIEITARSFGGIQSDRMLGCIINKVNGPVIKGDDSRVDLGYLYPAANGNPIDAQAFYQNCQVFKNPHFQLLGCINWNPHIVAPRMRDVAMFLEANVLYAGELTERRVLYVTLCARSINNVISSLLPGTLIITPSDRSDIIVATCMAALSGIKLAGLLLTGGYEPDKNIMQLCEQAIATGLPIIAVEENSFRSAVMLHNLNMEIPDDDIQRIEKVKNFVASQLQENWIKNFANSAEDRHMSPAAFRYQLSEMAQSANKKIVLPEGSEPRTLAAAAICAERGLARCILLGNAEEIHRVAKNNDVTLSEKIIILDPALIAERYVKPLLDLRKAKGLTEIAAREYLQDPVVVGTMMLQLGEVDGLVSGAVHTTANTIRPALQIIKTPPGVSLVSSVFFMCMPEQVLVFADCAVNPDPNIEELAQIAIQSADTAKAFGIEPRVAMISYSTGVSGIGQDVDKVRAAAELVKKMRPDLVVDGPLQYDAALIPDVAKNKAPNSPVAGRATVFIFPDLNTGNTTYKAVQRSADVLCIGPMLQGLNKPVNDLSRGATVDDIVYTIAITAIQANLKT